MSRTQAHGAKMGPRIVELVSRGHVATARKLLPVKRDLAMAIQHEFFGLTGKELRDTAGPLLRRMSETGEGDAAINDLIAFIARGDGQLATILGQQILGIGVGNSMSTLINNAFAPPIYKLIAAEPNLLPPIGVVTALNARGKLPEHFTRDWAHKQGLSDAHFDATVLAAVQPLPYDMLVMAWQRGLLTDEMLFDGLTDNSIDSHYHGLAQQLARQLPTIADLALAVLRGNLDRDTAVDRAGQIGWTPHDLDLLTENTGEPPGPSELLEAYRRGFIDQPRLVRGIRQSRVRNEWIDVIEKLRFTPMSPADAIQAAVQGHLSLTEAQTITAEGGLLPEHFQPLYETHGNPPGVAEMLSLLNRGQVSQSTVEQAIRESRYKNKYIPAIIELRRHLLPQRTIVSMVGKGVLTEASGVTHLLDLGISVDDAHALVAEASATRTAHHKTLAESTIHDLYLSHAITRDKAAVALRALGYSPTDVEFVLDVLDLRRVAHYTETAIGHVHSLMVARRIDEHEATVLLDRLSVPHAQRDRLLDLWALERAASVKQLTATEYATAAGKGLMPTPDAVRKLEGLGYDTADANLLVALHQPARRTRA